jgi:hypothetical protein
MKSGFSEIVVGVVEVDVGRGGGGGGILPLGVRGGIQ